MVGNKGAKAIMCNLDKQIWIDGFVNGLIASGCVAGFIWVYAKIITKL